MFEKINWKKLKLKLYSIRLLKLAWRTLIKREGERYVAFQRLNFLIRVVNYIRKAWPSQLEIISGRILST